MSALHVADTALGSNASSHVFRNKNWATRSITLHPLFSADAGMSFATLVELSGRTRKRRAPVHSGMRITF